MKSHNLIVGTLILLILSACGSKSVATEQLPVATEPSLPTSIPTSTVAPSPTPIPPTPTPEFQQYYTEEFEKDLKYWPFFVVDGRGYGGSVLAKEPIEKITLSAEGGFFKFDIGRTWQYVYSTYDPFDYEDVRVDARVENQGTNNNNISLICRYSKEGGWYEFNIANSGIYDILYGKVGENGAVNYALIFEGGSNKIKQGLDVNEYTVVCKGDTLTLFINGNQTREIKDTKFALKSGKVGISVSSFQSLPVKVNVDWIKISQP